MASVQDLLDRKGTAVLSIAPHASVHEAAKMMKEGGIGGLLVLDESGTLRGIFTERDVLRRVVAEGLDPAKTPVSHVMTGDVITCLPETSLEECDAIMSTRKFRHLPVADAEGVRGIVSSKDVLAYRVAESDDTIRYLNSYMFYLR
jgi:CBS domain-containing protein